MFESVLKLGTRNAEETKELIDAPDRTSAWLRRLPSLPALTSYIHYPPSHPCTKVFVATLVGARDGHDEKKK